MLQRALLLNSIKKAYLILTWVALGYTFYLVVLPFVSPYIYAIAPGLVQCPYRAITHTPCPFCGIVHDARAMVQGTFSPDTAHNPISIIVVCAIILEGLLRLMVLSLYSRITRITTVIYIDAVYHGIGFLVYIGYIVYFCLIRNATPM